MNDIETIIFVTKIQYTYIQAMHYMRHIRLELATTLLNEAMGDIEIILHKIDPTTELYNLIIDLRNKMHHDLSSIEDANTPNTFLYSIDEPPAANYSFIELVTMTFPCLSPYFNDTKEVQYKHKINKLQNVNNLLHHENETLKQTMIKKCKQD
jgi:hypothetical protein